MLWLVLLYGLGLGGGGGQSAGCEIGTLLVHGFVVTCGPGRSEIAR